MSLMLSSPLSRSTTNSQKNRKRLKYLGSGVYFITRRAKGWHICTISGRLHYIFPGHLYIAYTIMPRVDADMTPKPYHYKECLYHFKSEL